MIAISFARKAEDHFSYLKILYPDKLDRYSSLTDAQSKFSSIDITGIKFKCLFPTFSDRNKKLESDNHKLARLAKKIEKSIKMIYVYSGLLLIIVIVLMAIH